MDAEPSKPKNQPPNRLFLLFLGILLVLPALKLGYDTRFQPALYTISLSMTDYNPVKQGDPQYVGMGNYQRLFEDRSFSDSTGYGTTLVMTRLFILAILPAAVGLLAGAGNVLARSLNRLTLSVIAGLTIPIALAMLWRVYWSPMWGMEPSPIYDIEHSLASQNGARDLVMLLDALILIGTAGVAGITTFMAVMRGRTISGSVIKASLALWLVIVLGALLTFGATFTIPYILTMGGPGNATSTPGLLNFRQAFQNIRMGLAAANSSIFLVSGAVVTLLIWVVLELSRLRLATVPYRGGKATGFLALPLLLLVAYPLVMLVLWGNNLAGSVSPGDSPLAELTTTSVFSTVQQPWLTIWLIQLPVTWCAGFALGFMRPGGRFVSSLLFLVLLIMLAIPDELLHIAWYLQARELGILNSYAALALPWRISALPLLAFKLYFDGAYERYQAATQAGEQPQATLIKAVLLPSLAIVLVAGVVLCFQSAQDFNWSLLVLLQPDIQPLTLQLYQRMTGDMSLNTTFAEGAMQLLTQFAAVFIPIFALLHLIVLDRFALIAGRSSTIKNEAAASSEPF